MIETEHPKSLDPWVWADALRGFAKNWGDNEALARATLTHWFRDAMSQAYAEGRRDGEIAIRGVKKPWFAERTTVMSNGAATSAFSTQSKVWVHAGWPSPLGSTSEPSAYWLHGFSHSPSSTALTP